MVILYILIAIVLICMLSQVKYKVYVFLKESNVKYNFIISFLFHSIILEGSGYDGNVDLVIKILFIKKKFNLKHDIKKNKDKRESNKFNVFSVLRQVNIYKEYIMQLVHKVKPDNFEVNGQYGFDDPSVTGTAAGYIYMIKPVFKNILINIKPNFYQEIIDIKLGIGGKILPVSLIAPILKLIFPIMKTRRNSISKEKHTKQKFNVSET